MTKKEKEDLIKLRKYFIEKTDFYSERAKSHNASPQGSHMDRGNANGFIEARSKLEELFDYLNLWR